MKNIIVSNNISVKGKEINASSKTLCGFCPIYNATIIEKIKNKYNINIIELNSEFGFLENSNENILKELKKEENIAAIVAETGINSLKENEKNKNLIILKPSYGRVSRYGIYAYSSSMDGVCIYAKDLDEIGNILENISGRDNKDFTSLNEKFTYNESKKECSCGDNCKCNCNGECDCDCTAQDLVKFALFEELELDEKLLESAKTVMDVISSGEGTTNLAAIDGIRYGKREDGTSYEEIIVNSRSKFSYETKKNLLFGAYVLRKENLNNIYFKAMKLRRMLKEMIDDVFTEADFIVFRKEKDLKNVEENIIAASILSGFPILKLKDKLIISSLKNEKELIHFAKDILIDPEILDEGIYLDEIENDEEEENV